MMRERVRSFLGVWAPLIIAATIFIIAARFLLTSPPPAADDRPGRSFLPGWEATWYLCGAGLAGVGGLLIMSTLGRFRKARMAARPAPPDTQDDALK